MKLEFLDLSKVEQPEKLVFIVLQDIKGYCCNWNKPESKTLKKGSEISFTGSANNGDIFVTDKNGERYIISRTNACKTRYPYDKGLINLEFFKEKDKAR